MSIGHAAQDLQKLSSTKDKAGTHLNFHVKMKEIPSLHFEYYHNPDLQKFLRLK